jgi:type IV pilus assembly protein PilE
MMKKNHLLNKKLNGFSLMELLVVLIIIGVLTLLALPNLMPLITRAKTTEAKVQLQHVHMLETTWFYTYSRYSNNLDDIGYVQEKLVTEEGQANYLIEIIEADNKHFKARATSVTDFDGDGIFNVWEIDNGKNLKEVTKD